jgi:hypothetical protein
VTRAAFSVVLEGSSTLRPLNHEPAVAALRLAARTRSSLTLGEVFSRGFGRAYRTAFVRVATTSGVGAHLLAQGDIFAAEPVGRWIRVDCFKRPEHHRITRGQVLLAGVGTLGATELYGRCVVADARLEGAFMSEDVFALEAEDQDSDLALFTSAFLSTKCGVAAVRATSYGTKTLKLRRDLLQRLPGPRPATTTITRVAALVRQCIEMRELCLEELRAARRIIERLPAMINALAMCGERRSHSAVWAGPLHTLNAWNYASAGEALPFLLKEWRSRLRDHVPPEGLFRGGRYQRVPCKAPFGIDFLNQRDVFSVRPIPRRVTQPSVPRDWVYVPEFSLLVGGQGTLGEGELFGQVALVTSDLARGGITEHLLRIQAGKKTSTALLYAFLSTFVGRRLLRSTGVGTKLLSLRPDLVFALPVPDLESKVCGAILAHVERACVARASAVEAEEEAIRIVEAEVLPTWLA